MTTHSESQGGNSNTKFYALIAILVIGVALFGVYQLGKHDGNGNNDANALTGTTTALETCPKDYVLNTGDSMDVPAGCTVKGDVNFKGNDLFDHDAKTGVILYCMVECKDVKAPFGANVTNITPQDSYKELLDNGCVNGCTSVTVYVFDGTKLTTVDINSIPGTGKDNGTAPTTAPTTSSTMPPATQVPAQPTTTRAQITPDNVPDECDFSIEPGKTANVPAGCIVSGDVFVNGVPLFDNNQKTGLLVVINKASLVEAPYGAAVTSQGSNPQHTVDLLKAAMDERGCGNASRGGCDVVKVDVVN